jgi:hypothetical protein
MVFGLLLALVGAFEWVFRGFYSLGHHSTDNGRLYRLAHACLLARRAFGFVGLLTRNFLNGGGFARHG